MHARPQAVPTRALRGDRVLDIFARHRAAPALACEVIRLAQQVRERAQASRDLAGVSGEPRGMLDAAGDPAAIDRQQVLVARYGGDEAREQLLVLGAAVEAVLEIGNHLEQIPEVRIVGVQQVVDEAVAEQDDLDVERDRLGRKRYGAYEAVHFADGFDADLPRRQRALQRFPGERLHQQLVGVDQQIAAVCAMQRTGLDQSEVGPQCAELRDMVHAPDEVVVARVVLGYDRHPVSATVIDQHVYHVTPEGRGLRGSGAGHGRRFAPGEEIVDVVDHVLLDSLQVGRQALHAGVTLLDLRNVVAHCDQRHFPVELFQFLPLLAAPVHDVAYDVAEFFLQLDDDALDARLLLFRQLCIFLRADDFAALERRERETGGRAQQADLLCGGLRPQLVEDALVALGELGLDLPRARAVLVAVEHRRNRGAQLLHELLHVVTQRRSFPGRQCQREGAIRFVEVVDVCPVARFRALRDPAAENVLDERVAAAAGRPHHEQVEARARHVDSEFNGIACARLAQELFQIIEFRRGVESEPRRIATAIKRLGCQS